MENLTVEITDLRDESIPQRDNTFLRTKRYTFYLGKFGPFVERVPVENFDPTEIERRILTLRAHLENLSR